ncbi:hypothetical protein CR203_11145 [Salipaludibacillus neizhouensis]|uniref:Periplasmic binding protein domain-containing protein n=1 Tax=Salipaludibacillus neizhouensis TaxID=885475 RepID=A0A3A9K1T0_9BACI|nr:sugar ABC transporter substrate-binding protein [Salipaludibacillus neizhouensis]RKL67064.1 hypothetical protein CR203_11145 [Salipaludibacillus neizhouensis]
MKSKYAIYSILCILSIMMLAACGNNDVDGDANQAENNQEETVENNGEVASDAEGSMKVGMTVLDLSNPFFVQLTTAVEELAAEEGYEVIINDPRDDVNSQIEAIQNFVAQDVDAIIVTATDQNAINDAVQEAKDAGIPVLAHTTKLENADAWIGADEYGMGLALGEQAGQWIKEVHDGQGGVGILNFDQIEQVIQRKEGIIDGIRQYSPDVEVVGDQQAGDPNTAYDVSEGFLQANPDMIGIFGINDGGALGAYNAAVGAGKESDTFAVGGIDAVPEAIDAIGEEGIYKFTVDQQPILTAETIVEVMVAIINGDDYEVENEIEVRGVNESNIEEYQ